MSYLGYYYSYLNGIDLNWKGDYSTGFLDYTHKWKWQVKTTVGKTSQLVLKILALTS